MASLKKKKKKGGSKLMNKALAFYLTSVETPLREWCRAHVEPFDDPSIDWTASSIEMRHEWHSVYADVRVAPRRACAAASSCRGARVFHRRRTPHSTRARSLSPHSRTPQPRRHRTHLAHHTPQFCTQFEALMGPFIEETGGLSKWHSVTIKTLRAVEAGNGGTGASVLVAVLGAFADFTSFVLFMRTVVLEVRQGRFASGKEDMPAMPAMPAAAVAEGGGSSKLDEEEDTKQSSK